MPSVSLLAGAMLGFGVSYPGGPRANLYGGLLFFGLPIVTTIGCGIFASLASITHETGHETVTPGRVALRTLLFFLMQIFLAPIFAVSIAFGCSAIVSSF